MSPETEDYARRLAIANNLVGGEKVIGELLAEIDSLRESHKNLADAVYISLAVKDPSAALFVDEIRRKNARTENPINSDQKPRGV